MLNSIWNSLFSGKALLFVFLIIFGQVQAQAQESGLLFFPKQKERPKGDLFELKAGSRLPFCLRLDKQDKKFDKIRHRVTGLKVIFENQEQPPKKLRLTYGHLFKKLQLKSDACLQGHFRLPKRQAPGHYQLVDVMLVLDDNSFYPFKKQLYEFKYADELKIFNEKPDNQAPRLLDVQVGVAKERGFRVLARDVLVLEPLFLLQFSDSDGRLKRSRVHLFLRLFIDEHPVDLVRVQCHRYQRFERYACHHKIRNMAEEWLHQKVQVKLDSVEVEDRNKNRSFIDMQTYVAKLENPKSYVQTFSKKIGLQKRHSRELRRYDFDYVNLTYLPDSSRIETAQPGDLDDNDDLFE